VVVQYTTVNLHEADSVTLYQETSVVFIKKQGVCILTSNISFKGNYEFVDCILTDFVIV
jgi:hypothetical protein